MAEVQAAPLNATTIDVAAGEDAATHQPFVLIQLAIGDKIDARIKLSPKDAANVAELIKGAAIKALRRSTLIVKPT